MPSRVPGELPFKEYRRQSILPKTLLRLHHLYPHRLGLECSFPTRKQHHRQRLVSLQMNRLKKKYSSYGHLKYLSPMDMSSSTAPSHQSNIGIMLSKCLPYLISQRSLTEYRIAFLRESGDTVTEAEAETNSLHQYTRDTSAKLAGVDSVINDCSAFCLASFAIHAQKARVNGGEYAS